MQPVFYTTSNSHHIPVSWKIPGTLFSTLKPDVGELKGCCGSLSLRCSSLRISLDCETNGDVEKGSGPSLPVLLPVVIKRSGRISRYFTDGDALHLVGVDGGAPSYYFYENGFPQLFKVCSSAVRGFFIPSQVRENYMGYVKWKFLHRVFSSALQVLATQAMFRAMGIGYSRSFPSAAALNWVLKDGLGRLGRCIYSASLASAFDANLKRVRFSTSVLFSASIGLELLTPAFPQYFLLLAAVANIAKQISLACYLATCSAIYRSFALADNLGEVSAKAQVQTVCFDIVGFVLAAFLNMWFGKDQRLQTAFPFFVCPIFSALDLLGIYHGLKHVHLQTLTKDRLEIILRTWIELGCVPSPAEVSKEEGINFFGLKGKRLWPIRIGCLNPKHHIPKWSVTAMQRISSDDYYFVCMEIFCRLKRTRQEGILLCLREGASTSQIIMGLLQACYIRKTLVSNSRGDNREGNPSDSIQHEWSLILEDTKRSAEGDLSALVEQMSKLGWVIESILLTTEEQARYNYLDY